MTFLNRFIERMDKLASKLPMASDEWREVLSITEHTKAHLSSLEYWHDFYKAKCESQPPAPVQVTREEKE